LVFHFASLNNEEDLKSAPIKMHATVQALMLFLEQMMHATFVTNVPWAAGNMCVGHFLFCASNFFLVAPSAVFHLKWGSHWLLLKTT
jgi:hypothetical protein